MIYVYLEPNLYLGTLSAAHLGIPESFQGYSMGRRWVRNILVLMTCSNALLRNNPPSIGLKVTYPETLSEDGHIFYMRAALQGRRPIPNSQFNISLPESLAHVDRMLVLLRCFGC